MSVFDASSMIKAWDAYPIAQFPPFWDWIAEKVAAAEIVISRSSYDEIGHIAPDCRAWLDDHDCKTIDPDNAIVQAALAIKADLGIVNDQYKPKAVDESDILTIATAKVLGVPLVSDESPQAQPPADLTKYRIPRVCLRPAVAVQCADVLQFIKASGKVFG
jgi:hypothetical protein